MIYEKAVFVLFAKMSSQTIGIVLTNPHYCDSIDLQTTAIV